MRNARRVIFPVIRTISWSLPDPNNILIVSGMVDCNCRHFASTVWSSLDNPLLARLTIALSILERRTSHLCQ